MMTNDSSGFFSSPTLSLTESYSEITLLTSNKRGFSALYRSTKDGKQFILKALREEYRGNPIYEELLRKEYDLGYMLEHIHIRRTYGFGKIEGLGSTIIMEYIVGRTLREYCAEPSHSSQERQRIVDQLLEAIAFAHKHQIVHRDLKPENIIITHNGDNVKVIDFGLSDSDSYISLKDAAGTLHYAAPELLQGQRVDFRSDIYSLGVIISELLPPHRTTKRIVDRATMYSPDKRYQSIEALGAALHPKNSRPLYLLIGSLVVILSYLTYSATQSLTKEEYAQTQSPSATLDKVSEEEFARRQAISSSFFRDINARYVTMMQDIYTLDCTVEALPDIDSLQSAFAAEYRSLLDSTFAPIISSSLYKSALRNLSTHNAEMFSLIRNNYPTSFWGCSHSRFTYATDEYAVELRANNSSPSANLPRNYNELSHEQQQQALLDIERQKREYIHATTLKWAQHYRHSHKLSPLPDLLLEYF